MSFIRYKGFVSLFLNLFHTLHCRSIGCLATCFVVPNQPNGGQTFYPNYNRINQNKKKLPERWPAAEGDFITRCVLNTDGACAVFNWTSSNMNVRCCGRTGSRVGFRYQCPDREKRGAFIHWGELKGAGLTGDRRWEQQPVEIWRESQNGERWGEIKNEGREHLIWFYFELLIWKTLALILLFIRSLYTMFTW